MWNEAPMRHLMTASRVIALLAFLGIATACGSAATLQSSGAPASGSSATSTTTTSTTTAPASGLAAVSCPAAGSGRAGGAPTRAPLSASGSGRAGHPGTMHAPPQQAQSVTVAGVSCTSAANCMAVGDYSYGATARPGSSYR